MLNWTIEHHSRNILATVKHDKQEGTYVYATEYAVQYSGRYWFLTITEQVQNEDGSTFDVARTIEFDETLSGNIGIAESYAAGTPLIPLTELAIDPPF